MNRIVLLVCITVIFQAVFPDALHAQADFYEKHWSEVYRFELIESPKSARAITDSIYSKAKHDKNVPQFIKALIYRSKFAMKLEENAELHIVQNLENEIKTSRSPLKNILESMVAQLYWQYFKEHRSSYYGRTHLAEKVSTDFRTWDADLMFEEIDRHFQRSLQEAPVLQKISLSTIDDLLIQAEGSKLYRPTLYDFLAQNALSFYGTSESVVTKPIQSFTLHDPRYFNEVEILDRSKTDSLSPLLQALKIYKDLLTFHQATNDTTAYIDMALERLQFLMREGNFDNADDLYKKALAKFKTTYKHHPASTLIDVELATILNKEGTYEADSKIKNQFGRREALDICNEAIRKFPQGDGVLRCKIIRDNILSQELALTAEEYLPVNMASRLLVKYTNVDSLTFTVFKIDKGFIELFYSPMNDSVRISKIRELTPVMHWSAGLVNLHDYQSHTTEVIVPKLEQGLYLMLAQQKSLSDLKQDDLLAYSSVQVTDLSLIESTFPDTHRFQVVDRNTGKPIEGAAVHLKSRRPNYNVNNTEFIDEDYTSDKNGFIELSRKNSEGQNVQATIRYGNDEATVGDYYIYRYYHEHRKEEDETTGKVFLFSDRSIYRPGQTVYFKGILIKTKGKKTSVVGGEYVEVTLEDANYQDVASLRLKTNSFGSFSGEFKLPATGLTGDYTLNADEDDEDDSRFYDNLDDFQAGELTISVEEYKRPTFETTFKPVTETFSLNDTISAKGTAVAYSGSKISGAKVSYHVKRNVRYPQWYYWYYSNTYSQPQEIAFGETVTNKDGEFIIDFKALPDESVSKDSKPVFSYEVSADVTDVNGETRSATAVIKAGYHTLLATIDAPTAMDRKAASSIISINTENLNGQFIPARGIIRIYKLKSPPAPSRVRPWNEPDLQAISEDEFRTIFPHELYEANADPKKWKKGKLIMESSFNTAVAKEITFKTDRLWDLGRYVIELTTTDASGADIVDMKHFTLTDATDKKISDNQILVFELDRESYKVGDVAHLKIGSASPDITITVDIEKNHNIVKTNVIHFSNNSKEILIPVTEDMREGFAVYASATCYNSFIHETKVRQITTEVDELDIETETFKDKLQPGGKETWSFVIKSKDEPQKEAEVLASMYDASLDQFKKLEWSFNPIDRQWYSNSCTISGSESFGIRPFSVLNVRYQNKWVPGHYYDQFDWFGFSYNNSYYISKQYMQRFYSSGPDANNPSLVTMVNRRNMQRGFIYGQITTHDGEALPGVNVLIKGTIRGTVTDANGNYSIEAGTNEVLAFSFIGYSSIEAVVGRKNTINVMMEEEVMALSEVVVTGYGMVMRKNVTGSVSTITSTTAESDVELSYGLQGRAAGVTVTGMPGGDAKIIIRGSSSLTGDSQPLYVVDGVIVESSKIDQSDLGTVQLLKGLEATAIYGSRATNGVIIVTTKSGQKKLDEEMAKVNVRKNFNETAFFFPHLIMDENGRIQFTFTTPESLTRWKFQLLAHTKDLMTATKTLQAVTQKELMVTPNAPRFMRAGDDIIFMVKIANLSKRNLNGKVVLQLSDAVTGATADQAFHNVARNQTFKISGKETTEIAWRLKVPTGIDAVQYKVVAKAGDFSDGEQNALPVLSNRMLVTETLPMYVRSGQTKTFSLDKLKTTTSTTLDHHLLTLEVTSNPAWYAIQSLPYLLEFPHECAEQTFSRYYSNTLASYIANSNPRIKAVFDNWSSSDALISNLEKNQELKSVIIEETPWLRDAQSESEQKKRLALLFDLNALKAQHESVITKLEDLQLSDGGFPWFSGGRYASPFITQHIAVGFGHLKHLKVTDENDALTSTIRKAVTYLDNEMEKQYEMLLNDARKIRLEAKNEKEGVRLEKEFLEQRHVDNYDIHYLYMRSFYADVKPAESVASMIDYYRNQSAVYWKEFTLYMKGMIALVHYRNQNVGLSKEILTSVKENSIISEELGMYWKENTAGWYWYQAPVETQALMIEAFAEIESGDTKLTEQEKRNTIDELRIWLLKNKQTSQWKTTKATTEAIYALLLNGTDWLSVDDQVQVNINAKKIVPDTRQPEAGTGYFKTSWKAKEITPAMSDVTLTKKSEGIAWAGLYWQYFEDLDKITPAPTSLKLSKKVFRVSNTDKGELLTEINTGGTLKVGDRLRIRIELTADRAMEFLHMKDMRAAGLEPVDVLSEYKWQDNLGYYQSTKDAATHFFFDDIQKGVYVFEYDLRVNNKGNFSNGITLIESMYAPEFSSHSEGIRIVVE